MRLTQVYNYLKAFAATFQLEQHVHFRTRVVRAVPVAASQSAAASAQPIAGSDGGAAQNGGSRGVGSCDIDPEDQRWQITTAPAAAGRNAAGAGSQPAIADGQSIRIFDALLVCNGHFSEPRLPDAAGGRLVPYCYGFSPAMSRRSSLLFLAARSTLNTSSPELL